MQRTITQHCWMAVNFTILDYLKPYQYPTKTLLYCKVPHCSLENLISNSTALFIMPQRQVSSAHLFALSFPPLFSFLQFGKFGPNLERQRIEGGTSVALVLIRKFCQDPDEIREIRRGRRRCKSQFERWRFFGWGVAPSFLAHQSFHFVCDLYATCKAGQLFILSQIIQNFFLSLSSIFQLFIRHTSCKTLKRNSICHARKFISFFKSAG